MPNKYRGEVSVPGVGVLKFDWDRVAALVTELGQDFDARISQAAVTMDLDTMATAVAIGTGKTAEDVRKASPPIAATFDALSEALNRAFHGAKEAPPANGKANPPKATGSRKRARTRIEQG